MISEELVVDHATGLAIPQGGDRHLAGVVRVARRIRLVQMMKSIDRVRRAIRERRIVVEGPPLLLETRNCIGDRDRAFELLQCAVDQGAMSPWAAVGNVEVIAPCLCLETRRTVRRNALAEPAVGAAEFAGAAGFLRQLFIAPHAFD